MGFLLYNGKSCSFVVSALVAISHMRNCIGNTTVMDKTLQIEHHFSPNKPYFQALACQ